MEQQAEPLTIDKIAAINPCVKFAIDNYPLLCVAHQGKTAMILNNDGLSYACTTVPEAYVAKLFDSMIDAMAFTQALDMGHVPYALIDCSGGNIDNSLLWSVGCRVTN